MTNAGIIVRQPPQEFVARFLSVITGALRHTDTGHVVSRSPSIIFQPRLLGDETYVLLPFGFRRVISTLQRLSATQNEPDVLTHNAAAVDEMAIYTPRLSDFLDKPIGMIRGCNSRHFAQSIAWIRSLRPHVSIAVWTPTRQSAADCAGDLGRLGVPAVVGRLPDFTDGETRVACGVELARDIQKYGILLFTGLSALRNKHFAIQYECAEHVRRFLLLSGNKPLAAYDSYLATAYFGFDEMRIGDQRRLVRPVSIAWLSVPPRMARQSSAGTSSHTNNSEASERGESIFDVIKQNIWRSPIRNRLVAALSKALVGHADSKQQHAHIHAAAPRHPPDRHVVVYVDSADHAAALAKRLQEWPISSGEYVNATGLTGSAASRLHAGRRRSQSGRYQIVTADGIGAIHWPDVDVVFRADAGGGRLPWLHDALIVKEDVCRPLLVVDVKDRDHHLLAQRAHQRAACYASAGWYAPDVEPSTMRLASYIYERLQIHG
jgi:hypothetical protein